MEMLKGAVTRKLTRVRITPLHGRAVEWKTIEEAINFIAKYSERSANSPILKYEVEVIYSNDDRILGVFAERKDAVAFLQSYKSS